MHALRGTAFVLCGLLLLSGCSTRHPMEQTLHARIARFAPTPITAPTTQLSTGDRQALVKLVDAAAIMDTLYLRQVWSGAPDLLARLRTDSSTGGRDRLRYFLLNMGPWSKLDHDSAFIADVPPRPLGANYYPPDMTKEEFTAWAATLPAKEREQAEGFFTTIRRDASRKLQAVPYSTEYRDQLERAAALLRDAAALTDNASLRAFLLSRADAFLSNDYYASDVAWMDLDSPIDVTIGPYETYMDGLFNAKAAFEAFIGVRDSAATARLAMFAAHLQDIENHLPIDPAYRNPKLGALAPIRVLDEVAIGGEAKAGVQTAAYNLPNDERIVREKGAKRVMLKNVQEAKFEKILKPIAAKTLSPSQQGALSFDAFFTHILAHELMHGLGPHAITVRGTATTVRQSLQELYAAWEEAKADVSGLFALQYLMDAGVVPKEMQEPMYITYLASMFRSVRFGINEAHGRGVALQFNYFMETGAVSADSATGTFSVNVPLMKEAVRSLTGIIMSVQAQGDYQAAKIMLEKYAVVKPPMQRVLDALRDVPVDIAPEFPALHP